jgi:hypothetical protein
MERASEPKAGFINPPSTNTRAISDSTIPPATRERCTRSLSASEPMMIVYFCSSITVEVTSLGFRRPVSTKHGSGGLDF